MIGAVLFVHAQYRLVNCSLPYSGTPCASSNGFLYIKFLCLSKKIDVKLLHSNSFMGKVGSNWNQVQNYYQLDEI